MDKKKFSKISESLRQYQRADLKEFQGDIGVAPIDSLYVDPLPDDAVLGSVLANNTTFLLGRKGTGKSTVFAKAQSELKKKNDVISIYIDVKSLYDILSSTQISEEFLTEHSISPIALQSHMLRKIILGAVLAELLDSISESAKKLPLIKKILGTDNKYKETIQNLSSLRRIVKDAKLEKNEIPVLQTISKHLQENKQTENTQKKSKEANAKVKLNPLLISGEGEFKISSSDFDKTLEDINIYNEYSDVIYKSFPFEEILAEIQNLLTDLGLTQLVIFFDDFSELNFLDQRLFVDVVLSPLNNSSNRSIKLKIAGYPGRVYYGKIDPGKADTISLDFSDLYETTEVQEMERSAADYTHRLLSTRFQVFNTEIDLYFDTSSNSINDYMTLMFQASFNVPRIMGHLLQYCYLDRISKGQKITFASIRLAARKYYENTLEIYFGRLTRYALEPFENKIDRYNQQQLLEYIINEALSTKARISSGELGGNYFNELKNPPTSHFIVNTELEDILASLESNFFLTKYKKTRNKDKQDVSVYALFLGLTEKERMTWGYPTGTQYRNYFTQRSFDYTRSIYSYLSLNQTIKCNNCGKCYPLEMKESLELYKWRCPECVDGICSIVDLSDDFREEVKKLNEEIMLDPLELEILTVLHDEGHKMGASEISSLIDTTHQMVGKRTSKLQEMKLVDKKKDNADQRNKSVLTKLGSETYFES